MIFAQVFAVLAFVASLTGMIGAVMGLLTFAFFMGSCCCSCNKCGLVTAGVLGILTAILLAVGALVVPYDLRHNAEEIRDTYGDEIYNDLIGQLPIRMYGMAAGAILWTLASVCLFIFACTGRYTRKTQAYESLDTGTDTTTFPAIVV